MLIRLAVYQQRLHGDFRGTEGWLGSQWLVQRPY